MRNQLALARDLQAIDHLFVPDVDLAGALKEVGRFDCA
jgi:hypothetical protein